jgi:hypothetical protein
MATQRVFKLLAAKDVAVASATTSTTSNISDGNVVAFRNDWTQLLAADTIAESSSIFIVQKVIDSADALIGNLNSFEIQGMGVLSYLGQKYQAPSPQITYVGLCPAGTNHTLSTGTGDITANSSLEYVLSIINKSQKEIYQVPRRYYMNSSSSATALEIANNLVAQVNADVESVVTASTIGNGTGTDGLTTATAWGIKLKGDSGAYYFEVGLSDAWEDTPVTYDVANFIGINTNAQLLELQELSQGYFGYMNRVWMPITIPSYIVTQSASAVANSGGTVAVTQNSDIITFSAAVTTELIVGDAIYISGVRYVIKTKTSSTVFHLSEPYVG